MPTVQIRNVPDDVANTITKKAKARRQTLSAYLRDLLAADAAAELRREKMHAATAGLTRARSTMDLSRLPDDAGATYVRQVRDDYERTGGTA